MVFRHIVRYYLLFSFWIRLTFGRRLAEICLFARAEVVSPALTAVEVFLDPDSNLVGNIFRVQAKFRKSLCETSPVSHLRRDEGWMIRVDEVVGTIVTQRIEYLVLPLHATNRAFWPNRIDLCRIVHNIPFIIQLRQIGFKTGGAMKRENGIVSPVLPNQIDQST